jgi:ribosomal protein S18 acetylase RimI-like enzyme
VTLVLQPLPEADFPFARQAIILGFARLLGPIRGLNPAQAHLEAIDQVGTLLTSGFHTPGHHLFHLVDAPVLSATPAPPPLGLLWVYLQVPKRKACLYWLEIEPASRGRKLSRQALTLLETWLLTQGITHLTLEVFADNPIACTLYRTSGYQELGYVLQKNLRTAP